MAATATATPRVAQEIAARLGLRDWVSIRSGFDRPNLAFDVVSVEGKGAVARKRAALLHVLERSGNGPPTRPAIVYCGTRKDTEEVAAMIAEQGIATVAYHAGMSPEARRASQAAFMEGRAEVVVATNAFGMGVDKADVRTVAHWALPTSLEAYYQEAGRGGRDGQAGAGAAAGGEDGPGSADQVHQGARDDACEDVKSYVGGPAPRGEDELLAIGHGQLDERERVLLSIAERAGAVELEPGGRDGLLVRAHRRRQPAQGVRGDQGGQGSRLGVLPLDRAVHARSAEMCRRRQILDHFGDEEEGAPSGRCCDVCDPDAALERAVSGAHDSPSAAERASARVRLPRAAAQGGRAGATNEPTRRRCGSRGRARVRAAEGVAVGAGRGQAGVHRGGERGARGGAAQAPAQRRGADRDPRASARRSARSTERRCWGRSSELRSAGGAHPEHEPSPELEAALASGAAPATR